MQQQSGTGTDLGGSIAQQYGLKRSPLWPEVQRAFLATHQQCAACPSNVDIQIHHIFPFHLCHLVYRGDLELDERNFIPLCEESVNDHHLLLGHLGDFESYNNYLTPTKLGRDAILTLIAELIAIDPGLAAMMIKANAGWMQASTIRPKPWGQWTPDEKNAFRKLLDELLPFQPTATASASIPYDANKPPDPAAIATTYHESLRGNKSVSSTASA